MTESITDVFNVSPYNAITLNSHNYTYLHMWVYLGEKKKSVFFF